MDTGQLLTGVGIAIGVISLVATVAGVHANRRQLALQQQDVGGKLTPTDAEILANRLGGLPLALRTVARRVGSSVLHQSFRSALDDYVADLHSPADRPPGALVAGRRNPAHTYELSLDALAGNGVPQARPLLRLLSCYAPAVPLPGRLLSPDQLASLLEPAREGDRGRAPVEREARRRVEDGLSGLRKFSLIGTRDAVAPAGGTHDLVVHPAIADANRICLLDDDTDLADAVRRTAVDLVAARLGDTPTDPPREGRLTYQELDPHLHALFETIARHLEPPHLRVLVRVTAVVVAARNWYGATRAGERLARVALATPGLPDDDPAGLRVQHYLAWAVAFLGRHAEAEKTYRSTLAARRRVLGAEHRDTLATQHEVAWIMAIQGRWVEAEEAYREVLDARQRILGADDEETLLTHHELGWAIANRGRVREAEEVLTAVLAARRRVLGDQHSRVLDTQHELAWAAALGGRWAEAEQAYREVLALRRRVIGVDHWKTQTTWHELAWTIAAQRPHAARHEYRKVLRARRRVLDEDHPDVEQTRYALDQLRCGQVVPAHHIA